MRVIITGGSGLVGRALTQNLTADGHEVIILSRAPGRVRNLPQNARAVGWDTRSADGWGHLADGATAIVNLAGESIGGEGLVPDRWTAQKRHRIVHSRLEAGRAVVEAVEAAADKPGVVIQASAIGYYGTHGDEIITEDHAPGDDFLAQACVQWEASTAPVEARGVRRAVARTALVLDTENGALPRIMLPYKLFAGGPFGNGEQWWSWIHLQDEARALRFLIEQDRASGPFNLSAPQPLPNDRFGEILGEVMGRPHYFPIPAFPMRTVLGEVAILVLEGQRVVPRRLQELGFSFRFPTLEEALRALLVDEA